MDDTMDMARNVTWKDIVRGDQELDQYVASVNASVKNIQKSNEYFNQKAEKRGSRCSSGSDSKHSSHSKSHKQMPLETTAKTAMPSQQSSIRLFGEKNSLNEPKDSKASSRLFKYLAKMKKDADAVSKVSHDSKLSSKSRLFSTQVTRQKWKDQMNKEHKEKMAMQDSVLEDTKVEDIDDEHVDPNLAYH